MPLSHSKPLAGIEVLDLTRLLPGAVATLHLADLGADVVCIDEPGEAAAASAETAAPNLRSALFGAINRNKRSLALDLKQPAGRDIFLRLSASANVIVESFRPGVVERLGVGYEAVRAINPRLVYCSITGYGQTSAHRAFAGHDINYLAMSGVADQIGAAGGPPVLPNLQIGDLLGGSLTAVMGILAALVDAQAHGTGRYIDVSMTGSLLAHSVVALASMTASGEPPERGGSLLSGGSACYNYYRTLDGRYLAVGALEPKFWHRLCDALERPALKPMHLAGGEEERRVKEELRAIFGAHTMAYWVEKLQDVDCCVTPVWRLDEAVARETMVENGIANYAAPLKMSGCEFHVKRTAPAPGEHSEEILCSAGYSSGEIAAFREARVVY